LLWIHAAIGRDAMQITFRDKKWELKGGITARDALKKTGTDPESVLIVVNGKLVTDDTILKDDDQVKLVAVVSGGSGI
jgi:sulfur carrier protein ThiS